MARARRARRWPRWLVATRLLDVGCGTGRFAVLAADRLGARVWGVDRSAEMLDEAKRRPGARGVGWRRAEAEQLPFRDGWFDGAHSHLVLHLVDDLPAASPSWRACSRPADGSPSARSRRSTSASSS